MKGKLNGIIASFVVTVLYATVWLWPYDSLKHSLVVKISDSETKLLLLLLLSHLSRVRLCATPKTAAHQAPPSLGFSRQEHWSGLPFPSPMHESEKRKWSRSVVSNSHRPHGLQPTRLLHPWDFPGKSTGVGCHCLLRNQVTQVQISALPVVDPGQTA